MSSTRAGGICRTCGTSLAEGEHGTITASGDNTITLSCRFPRVSSLPRTIFYLTDAEVSARTGSPAPSPSEPLSPSEKQARHFDEAFGK